MSNMACRDNNIGQEVNVVSGTYSGCKGKMVGDTEKIVYVELLGHKDIKRILQSSVRVITNCPGPPANVARIPLDSIDVHICRCSFFAAAWINKGDSSFNGGVDYMATVLTG